MKFSFHLPVEILFGGGLIDSLDEILADRGYNKGVLVCDPFFKENGQAQRIAAISKGRIIAQFSEIVPNPTIKNVDACAEVIRAADADFVLAMGGGSAMDCAKAACVVAEFGGNAEDYHSGGKKIPLQRNIRLIIAPTTSGTGSEVTWVSVLTDEEKHLKAPMASKRMLADLAIVDYKLTMGMPPKVTASTGIDVLSHAVEGFWSVKHQPICDAAAVRATKLVFKYLRKAYEDGTDEEAREAMSEAALLAGIAFGHPTTTGSHACSFPLTNRYHVPHGEACAFTLDSFVRINADCENGRIHEFARDCGFCDAFDLADGIGQLKKDLKLRTRLSEIGVKEEDIPALSQLSMHPNMKNNPTHMTVEDIDRMYRELI